MVESQAGFFGQGENALRDEGELALAAGHVVAAVFDAGFQLGEAFALAGHRGQAGRADVVGQAQRAEAGFPVAQGRRVLFFGQFHAAFGRVDFLSQLAALAFDRHHAFELRQMFFGVLQSQLRRSHR